MAGPGTLRERASRRLRLWTAGALGVVALALAAWGVPMLLDGLGLLTNGWAISLDERSVVPGLQGLLMFLVLGFPAFAAVVFGVRAARLARGARTARREAGSP